MEVLMFISFFLGASWDFFTEVTVPGFDFSFAALFVGLFLAALGLRFVFAMLQISSPTRSITSIAWRSKQARADAREGGSK